MLCRTLLLWTVVFTPLAGLRIGLIVKQGSDSQLSSEGLFSLAANSSSPLEPRVYEVPWWSALELSTAVCRAAGDGVHALVSLSPWRLQPLLVSQCAALNIPLEVPTSPESGSVAAAALIRRLGWESFAFVYDTDTGPSSLQAILRLLSDIRVDGFWRAYDGPEAAILVQQLPANNSRLVLATSERTAHLMMSSLTHRRFTAILVTPVGAVVQTDIHMRGSTLYKFSFANEAVLGDLAKIWDDKDRRPRFKRIPDEALFVVDALRRLSSLPESPRVSTSDCFGSVTPHKNVTASVSPSKLKIFLTNSSGVTKVDTWSASKGLDPQKDLPTAAFQKAQGPLLRVTSILNTPFLRRTADGGLEGYVTDLLEELSEVTGLRFDLHLSKDGRYGMQRNGRWNGMVGELVENETDLVLADLTKTMERAQAVYFGHAFMSMGLNILYPRPTLPEGASLLGALAPAGGWPAGSCAAVVGIALLSGALCYAAGRFTGAPDRVRALESKGTDRLSPCGGLWCAVGALLQRDTGVYPRSLSHRTWSVLWRAFGLLQFVLYLSWLIAVLSKRRASDAGAYHHGSSHDMLQNALRTGYPTIGCLKAGSTRSFFAQSKIGLFQEYGRYLQENPDATTSSYAEGVERVRGGGDYAFVMESLAARFHTNQRPCNVVATAGFLTTRIYAPALHPSSPYKEEMNHAILSLMESGTLRHLYERWWHNYTDECEDPNMDLLPSIYNDSMTLSETSGIFYLLLVCAVAALFAAAIEHYISSRSASL